MRYISTRGRAEAVTAGQAILKGLAEDGGLYVPEQIPAFSKPLEELIRLPYPSLAYEILSPYLTDFSEACLRDCIDQAYAYPANFDNHMIAPLKDANGVYFLELFHGRTLAFKDMALSLLPYLMTAAAAKYRSGHPETEIIVLTATSGDTGKAALEGFAHVKGVKVAVFYPEDGVSATQKRQMVTQEGENTYVFGVRGNFDDTQTGVKRIFSDKTLAGEMERAGMMFSSANSINIGRLLPQIVYYVYAYGQLTLRGAIETGEAVDFTVPTGNFGNILAGYYAKQMGLPIRRLICASNSNHVLSDFFNTGEYNVNRPFFTTLSPSMDILVSSNLERLLYHASGDAARVASWMAALHDEGRYQFDTALPGFYAAYATEDETREALRQMLRTGYLADPHTAVAYHAYRRFADDAGQTPNVILSTASPFKFVPEVCGAVLPEAEREGKTAEQLCHMLAELGGFREPEALRLLAQKPIRHRIVCDTDDMKQTLLNTVIFPRTK